MRSVVVLPAPLAPSRPVIAVGRLQLTPCTACTMRLGAFFSRPPLPG
jgi:hypothetical protein